MTRPTPQLFIACSMTKYFGGNINDGIRVMQKYCILCTYDCREWERGYRLLLSFLHRATSALTVSTPVMLPQTHGIYTLLTIIVHVYVMHQLCTNCKLEWFINWLLVYKPVGQLWLCITMAYLKMGQPPIIHVRWFTNQSELQNWAVTCTAITS